MGSYQHCRHLGTAVGLHESRRMQVKLLCRNHMLLYHLVRLTLHGTDAFLGIAWSGLVPPVAQVPGTASSIRYV